MNPKLLREKLEALRVKAQAICDKAIGEERDLTGEERQEVMRLMEEGKGLKGQIAQAQQDAELRTQIADMFGGTAAPAGVEMMARVPAGRGKSIGEQFAEAEAFRAWLKSVAPSGVIGSGVTVAGSPPVEFKHLLKALITGSDTGSAGAFVESERTGIYEPLGRRERTLMDLISRRSTSTDLVEFVRQVTKVQAATPVPEANVTDYTGATGEVSGEKPEGSLAFERVTAAVKTIAVTLPATKRALSDAAQVRGIIDQELAADCAEELEEQIYDGDGTGENFTGILHTSGVLVQTWDTDLFTTTRKAKTALRLLGRVRPTAWLLNPADWERLELTKDGNDRYYYGGPQNNGELRLWGIPIVESEVVDEGTGILGDWRKAVVWDREQASIQVSDSHNDFFIRNMLMFLCEIRAAFGIIRPAGFIQVELQAGS